MYLIINEENQVSKRFGFWSSMFPPGSNFDCSEGFSHWKSGWLGDPSGDGDGWCHYTWRKKKKRLDGPKINGPWKRWLIWNIAIFGIHVKFLGCKLHMLLMEQQKTQTGWCGEYPNFVNGVSLVSGGPGILPLKGSNTTETRKIRDPF